MDFAKDYPPNIDAIAAVLPGARRPGVVFSFGNTVYVPDGQPLHPAILAHELAHCARQPDPYAWWERYLADHKFRLDEELVGHRAEYQWYVQQGVKQKRLVTHLREVAAKLSSPLYNVRISEQEARWLIAPTHI